MKFNAEDRHELFTLDGSALSFRIYLKNSISMQPIKQQRELHAERFDGSRSFMLEWISRSSQVCLRVFRHNNSSSHCYIVPRLLSECSGSEGVSTMDALRQRGGNIATTNSEGFSSCSPVVCDEKRGIAMTTEATGAHRSLVCVRAVCYATQPEWENDKSTRIHFRHRFNCVAPRILRKINLMLPGIQVETAAINCENHSTASRLLYVHIQKLKLSMISIPSSLNDTPFNRDRYHFDSFNLWLWWPIKRIIVTTQIHGHLFIMVLANGEFRWEYWRNSMITFFYNVTRKQIPIKYYIYLFQ